MANQKISTKLSIIHDFSASQLYVGEWAYVLADAGLPDEPATREGIANVLDEQPEATVEEVLLALRERLAMETEVTQPFAIVTAEPAPEDWLARTQAQMDDDYDPYDQSDWEFTDD